MNANNLTTKTSNIQSEIWYTFKEYNYYLASKNIENIKILIQTESIRELNRLMLKIDHESALQELIRVFQLGKISKSLSFNYLGELNISYLDQTSSLMEIQDLEEIVQKHNHPKHVQKERIGLTVFRHLLSSATKTALSSKEDEKFVITLMAQKKSNAFKKNDLQDFQKIRTLKPSFFSKVVDFFKGKSFLNIFSKSFFFKPKQKLESFRHKSGKRGIDILSFHFEVQGSKLSKNRPSWLHDKLLPYLLLRAVKFAREDQEEMNLREKAAVQHLHYLPKKTLVEKREEFEQWYRKSFPKDKQLIRQMSVVTIDGVKLETFVIANKEQQELVASEQRWILFLNAGDEAYENNLSMLLQISQETGVSTYTGNYRGVGGSSGAPTRSYDLVLDGEAMLQHLLTAGVLPQHILIHGASLGGGVGAEIAARHPGVHLCNDRSFTKFTDAAYELAPRGLKDFTVSRMNAVSWELDSVSSLDKITGHVLIISSVYDRTIRGRAKLGLWVSSCWGVIERKVIWLEESYPEETSALVRSVRAHCDPITITSKYGEYLDFVQESLYRAA